MVVSTPEQTGVKAAVQAAVERYGTDRAELIPILNDVNSTLGYLPAEALEEVSRRLKTPSSQLMSVASFYQMLSTRPLGRHVVQFCESAPCHVVGGREVWRQLQDDLNLNSGETSNDGKWSLLTVSCLGLCGVGPVIMIDEDVYGNVEPHQIQGILARYD